MSAQELYLAAKNEGLNLTMPQIQAAVAANDVDGDGKLSLQEFLQDPALADLSLLAAASSGQQVSIVTEGGMSMPAPSALKSDPVAASATTMSVQSMSDTTTAGGSSAATTASPATLAQALAQTAIQASTAAYGHVRVLIAYHCVILYRRMSGIGRHAEPLGNCERRCAHCGSVPGSAARYFGPSRPYPRRLSTRFQWPWP